MKIAVITGASSGMGREFVFQLDRQHDFDEIWVIARRLERLEELKGKTRAKIRPISFDLTKKESIEEYAKMLETEKPEVEVLVNAGNLLFNDRTERYGACGNDVQINSLYEKGKPDI